MKIFPHAFVLIIALIQTSVSFAQPSNETLASVNQPSNETPASVSQPSNEIKPVSLTTEMTNSFSKQKEFKQASTQPLTIDQIRQFLPTIGSPAEKFEFLRNQRKTTLDAISNTSNSLSTNEINVSSLQASVELGNHTQQKSLEEIKNQLVRDNSDLVKALQRQKTLKDSKQTTPNEINEVNSDIDKLNRYIDWGNDDLKRAEIAEKAQNDRIMELTKLRENRALLSDSLVSYQRILGSIDDMVNQLFIASDVTNNFKLKMSIAFAILVAIVIIGFFIIAGSNQEIKKIIFANEAGIQFVTVFSIVIAVILFGIIGVLEGKELSALLGGLSGYILGKSK